MEPVQAEAGIIIPDKEWLKAIREQCSKTGTLLIFDEIQSGFGRTGSLWAFEQAGVVPDILLLGKALGGGMPLGAFIASHDIMQAFTDHPVLGHITTFGGHPVSCAAGMAAMQAMLDTSCIQQVPAKATLFLNNLDHPLIKEINAAGLWMSVRFDSFETNKYIIDQCIQNGVLTDWFLFAPECLRISPPLIIDEEIIKQSCTIITAAIEAFSKKG